MKPEAVSRLALAILILIGIAIGLMTFLIITQAQILGVINITLTATLPGGPLYGKPLMALLSIVFSIQIYSGTNILVTIGVALNELFFGSYWWMNYGINYLIISYLIQFLGSL
nr:hypothetical protein [Candidatus Freyarchaeota archaeon]